MTKNKRKKNKPNEYIQEGRVKRNIKNIFLYVDDKLSMRGLYMCIHLYI